MPLNVQAAAATEARQAKESLGWGSQSDTASAALRRPGGERGCSAGQSHGAAPGCQETQERARSRAGASRGMQQLLVVVSAPCQAQHGAGCGYPLLTPRPAAHPSAGVALAPAFIRADATGQ